MPEKNASKTENIVKDARGASLEKKGSPAEKHSPGAAKIARTMSQDALRNAGTEPGPDSSKL